jgi:hypothetical protein
MMERRFGYVSGHLLGGAMIDILAGDVVAELKR